jgi:hypothetical protein
MSFATRVLKRTGGSMDNMDPPEVGAVALLN